MVAPSPKFSTKLSTKLSTPESSESGPKAQMEAKLSTLAAAEQTAWIEPRSVETLDSEGTQSRPAAEDASLRSGAPTVLASQSSLWSEEPTRLVGHSLERLTRDDGVGITICHTHRREVLGVRSPCR